MGLIAVDNHSEWSHGVAATGARVSEIQFRRHTCPRHWHERPSLGIVLHGSVSKRFQRESIIIEPNAGYVLPAGIMHSDQFGDGSRVVMIEIDPDHPLSAERLRICGPVFERWRKIEDRRLRWFGHRLANEIRRNDAATTMAIDGLIGEVLSVATRCRNTGDELDDSLPPDWLIEAREIARSQLHERISVTEIAEEVGVHPAYLARRFRAEFGITPAAYARHARLNWASDKLISSDMPIAEIAIQAGFSDQSHFTRAFRTYLDQTPAEYRNNYRIHGAPGGNGYQKHQ